MIRPGASVNKPVTTRAREKIQIIAERWAVTLCRRACRTARGTTASVNNERRWMGLQGPQVRIVWMKSELPATRIMSTAHAQPMVRCGSVPLGARSCTAPRPIAAKAKAAWNRMIGGASSSGARVTPRLTLEHAVDVAQRFLASFAVALIISVARLVHIFGDRLGLLAREIARLLFGGGDRSRSRLAMHGGEG